MVMISIIIEAQDEDGPRHNPGGYRNALRTTSNRVLLVEGADDKKSLELLLIEAHKHGIVNSGDRYQIDTGEMLKSPEDRIYGNRDKVELVCHGLPSASSFDRFVAFTDRGIRDLDEEGLIDNLMGHRIQGRLVWSRGRSIEHYLFDSDTYARTIRIVALTSSFEPALELFRDLFHGFLKVACALSYAAKTVNRISLIVGTVEHKILSLSNGVEVDSDAWTSVLLTRTGNNRALTEEIIESYQLWFQHLAGADVAFQRWSCHGHIGFRTLWAGYAPCVRQVTRDSREVGQVLQAPAVSLSNATISAWAYRAMTDGADYPREILAMLVLLNNEALL